MADSLGKKMKEILFVDSSNENPVADVIHEKLTALFSNTKIEVETKPSAEPGITIHALKAEPREKKRGGDKFAICKVVSAETLTPEHLFQSYNLATDLVKSVTEKDYPFGGEADIGSISVFIVFRRTEIPLDEVGRLYAEANSASDSDLWPDAVAIIDAGLLSFGAFFPGRGQSGDFFLTRKRDDDDEIGAPSATLQLMGRSSLEHTFAKIASLIFLRCAISLRDEAMMSTRIPIDGFPSHGIAFVAYQFNLAGMLQPQIFDQTLTAHTPVNRFRIKSENETLGTIQRLPWQDGAVIALRGHFPLELLLLVLRQTIPNLTERSQQFFRNEDAQVSYVLPISDEDYVKMLAEFAQIPGNLRVEQDTDTHIVQKMADEGLSSTYMARLRYGVLALREGAFPEPAEREKFDEQYENVINGLDSVREASRNILDAWNSHEQRINSGEIVSRTANSVRIEENIDRTLRREAESLLNAAMRVVKTNSQMFLREHGIETDFLFKKSTTFTSRIEELKKMDPDLAGYLEETRKWTEPLINLRNNHLEHGAPLRLKVEYECSPNDVKPIQPLIGKSSLTDYSAFIFDRCCLYVEEMTTHCIKKKLPGSLTITEVPSEQRNEQVQTRFAFTVYPAGLPEWNISYDDATFQER